MKKTQVAAMSVYPGLKNSDERGSGYCVNVEFNEFSVERQTIVMLHGYLGSIEDYNVGFEVLNEKYNLIAIDLRAHGSSAYPEDHGAGWAISDLAEDVIQVVDLIAPETSFTVVASSMSTAIALEMARSYPELINQLFLMSPTSKFTIPSWVKLIFSLGKFSTSKFIEGLIDTIGTVMHKMASPQEKEFWLRGLEKFNEIDIDIHKKIFNETLPSWEFRDLKSHVPIFIVAGEDDKVVPYKDSIELLETLPNASLLTLKNTKHHIVREKKDMIFDLIDQWIKETDEILSQSMYSDENLVQEVDNKYKLMRDHFENETKTPEVQV